MFATTFSGGAIWWMLTKEQQAWEGYKDELTREGCKDVLTWVVV